MAKKDKENTAAEKSGKKDKKDKSQKKPNRFVKWFKDLKIEFKKVVWPTKKTVINNTTVVLIVVALSSVIVGLLDTGFLNLFKLIYQQG
ncbi:MAG: preprotein translocase subunit SecE [Alistipes sp.]|nr:preprotein translocase subunit SecE [Alistipes sp.]